MTNQTVLVLSFGGRSMESVARLVRECNVYSRIESGDMPIEDIKALSPIGIILTGNAMDVNDPASTKCRSELFELGIPVLGIGYGMHAMTYALMGRVEAQKKNENGRVKALVDVICPLFEGLSSDQQVHMCHSDAVTILPRGFKNYGRTAECGNAVMGDPERGFYGVQFHPELDSGTNGFKMICNFLYRVCNAVGDYDIDSFEEAQLESIRDRVATDKVMLALSGGIDSAVCAALLTKIIPGQLYCVFVDHGFMRENEADEIEAAFKNSAVDIIRINAKDEFLSVVEGVADPAEKCRRLDRIYADILRAEAKKLGDVRYLAKGTVYTDVVSSLVSADNYDGNILAEDAGFKGFIEPLRELFKDEVRLLGRKLGLAKSLLGRQSFPSTGLALRIMGEITVEKLEILRRADAIFRTELQKTRCQTNQYFAVLGDIQSFGEDCGYTVILHSVSAGRYTEIPHRTLGRISASITDEIREVSRVVYDITNRSL